MAGPQLSPQARRLQVIIVSAPIMGACAYVLYERLVQGKPRRTLPRDEPDAHGPVFPEPLRASDILHDPKKDQ
ncbi:hypothetical protein PsYK624_095540 [Phanerochaete sordida]|uniref:Uncharacterized protein n=1 Tax=Phanerochaete sordida TaxID=48140 RepID=A0A9P3GEL0_9APHY|nr:hypothetical protein PsYK624_095540 [Phanerochaete sordida]